MVTKLSPGQVVQVLQQKQAGEIIAVRPHSVLGHVYDVQLEGTGSVRTFMRSALVVVTKLTDCEQRETP